MKSMVTVLMLLVAFPAAAHGPTPRKTDESMLVNAAPEAVWKKLSEPCAITTWHQDVAECTSSSPLKRTLTLKNGGVLEEGVDELLPVEMVLSYRLNGDIDIKALPVSSMSGRIKLKAEGDGVRVSWMARYYRAFTGNEPPPGQDDEAAQSAVDAYVKSGLEGLKTLMTAKE